MKKTIINVLIWVLIPVTVVFLIFKCITSTTSSPVENTVEIDSTVIITTGECEEVMDSDDISVPHDSFGRVILPDWY